MTSICLKKNCFVIIILIVCGFSSLCGQENLSLNGIVREKGNETIIVGASISIKGTKLGAYSNSKGLFSIKNVPQGKQTLVLRCVGYKSAMTEVNVTPSMATLEITLEPLPYSTDEVVVSASKRAQAVQDVPISISVVDQRAIADRSITKIDDALRYVSGVNVARDQVSIRGSSGFALGLGSRTAVLLDGFPLLSGDNADIKFDMMPMTEIERIEVIKGAGSALYGTGALGGVVSMFTRAPKEEAAIQIRSFIGGYSEPNYESWQVYSSTPLLYGIDGAFSQKLGDFAITATGGVKYDRSYRLWDDSRRWNLYSKMSYNFSPQTSVFAFVNIASELRGNFLFWADLDSATKPPSGVNLNERRLSGKTIIGAELKHLLSDDAFFIIRSSAFATSFNELYKNQGEEVVSSDAVSWFTDAQWSSALSKENHLTSGLTFTLNSVNSGTFGTRAQTITSAYIQLENSSLPNTIITAGTRIDIEQTQTVAQQHTEFSPKLGISYNGFAPFRLRGSLGRGFRTPAVAERFADIRNPILVSANPNLIPEKSMTYEVGTSLDFALGEIPTSIDFSIYHTDFKDLVEPQIVFVGTSPSITFNNVLKARIQGAELTFRSLLGFVGIETSLTALYARNVALETPLKFRSPILWYNRLWIPLSEFEIQCDYRFIARAERILDDNERIFEQFIPDVQARVPVHVVDARFIYNLAKSEIAPMKLIVNAKNILNYYYVEVIGNLAPIRQFSLQCEVNL